MYLHRPQLSFLERIVGSARTLAAIVLTALLASALTVHWSDAAATSAPSFIPVDRALVTGVPVTVEGAVVGAGDGLVALLERGAETPVAFPVDASADLTRDGQAVALDALYVGDTVRMTIDGRTGEVLRLHAMPAATAAPALHVPGAAALLAAVGLIAGATALAILNLERLPALPARFQGARLISATAR